MSTKDKDFDTTLNMERTLPYLDYIETPLKIAGCWDLFRNTDNEFLYILNYVYLGFVLFLLTYIPVSLIVHLNNEWEANSIMSSVDKLADCLPIGVSLVIIAYYAIYRKHFYELVEYINENFKYHSAKGLTNMTMSESYKMARRFGRVYTACCTFSVTSYAIVPIIVHFWTKAPLQHWIYMGVTRSPIFEMIFFMSFIAQLVVGFAMGQFGVFFASNSILICGQLDILCCSLRNAKYTALLQNGVKHSALKAAYSDIQNDEMHNYSYNVSEMKESHYHYDEKTTRNFADVKTQYDIYSEEFDPATMRALQDCAHICQVVNKYKDMFDRFVSPLLVLRVVQVTLYLCTLLYAATLKFEMTTVEYLAAVALDIFVYCYYGNQIILQADRVSTAAYHSAWHTMGVRPRRVLLNILLANKRPVVVRAGRFLPMDLHTFVVIIKTSFSYYTLLVNVNEK